MSDNEFQLILAKYLANECSDEEKNVIENWYEDINKNKSSELRNNEDLKIIELELKSKIDENIDSLNSKENKLKVFKMPLIKWAAAAVLILAFGLSFYFSFKSKIDNIAISHKLELIKNTTWIEKKNDSDKFKNIFLEDGSTISLSPSSSIWYPKHFEKEKREIVLSGEAFFQIARDTLKPLYVITDKLTTKVLGTSFIIRAYENDIAETVEVKTGKVAVYSNSKNKDLKAFITINQKVIYTINDNKIKKTLVENPVIVKNTKIENLSFSGKPLEEIINNISDLYQIKIIINNNKILDCPITATFNDQSLYTKLNLICKSIDATYEISDGKIIINGGVCEH